MLMMIAFYGLMQDLDLENYCLIDCLNQSFSTEGSRTHMGRKSIFGGLTSRLSLFSKIV